MYRLNVRCFRHGISLSAETKAPTREAGPGLGLYHLSPSTGCDLVGCSLKLNPLLPARS
jgi:hypothetical protein